MRMEIGALSDVTKRYVFAVRLSWRRRKEMDAIRRTSDELAFQPAVIELTDSPISPVPHRTMQIIAALFLVTVVWASFGKLDIVAVASGKIVTDSRTKTIQPLEASIVRRIVVGDGQFVKRGQTLLELDAVGVRPDQDKARGALITAQLNAERSAATARAFDEDRSPHFEAPQGALTAQVVEARALALNEFEAYKRKSAGLKAIVAQKEAEKTTVENSLAPLREYARIAAERVADYKRLLGRNYVSRQEYLMREQERITAERDLATQSDRLAELSAAIVTAREELASTMKIARHEALDSERQAREQVAQLSAELARSAERSASMQLTSPVDGTIQQLAVHTIGGVVTPGQSLMSVVPSGEALEVEATVLNQDIGFVRPGQDVVTKIQSFPYSRYGDVTGHIISVSHDAAQDEKLGLVFPVRVALDRSRMSIDGQMIDLTPGMALSVEVKTGKRTVISYLLEPLNVARGEAMRER